MRPQEYLAEIAFCGALATVGLVEGLLLLAENLPRCKPMSSRLTKAKARVARQGKPVVDGAENRQAWMLIGMAIRAAYGLGLDQVSVAPRSAICRIQADSFDAIHPPSCRGMLMGMEDLPSTWNVPAWLGRVSRT
jgi:hypothetical protein